MADAEHAYWESVLSAPRHLRGAARRAANERVCDICEGLLTLAEPAAVRTPNTLHGHDHDCLALVWAGQLDFTVVGGGGGGGGEPGVPMFGSSEPVFGSSEPVFGDS